jgi:hypothetical protein
VVRVIGVGVDCSPMRARASDARDEDAARLPRLAREWLRGAFHPGGGPGRSRKVSQREVE